MKILVTGAAGQIGTELSSHLAARHGGDQIIISDIDASRLSPECRRESLDVRDESALDALVRKEGITHIYHLAAILSGNGEKNPLLAYDVNMNGTKNVLEVARSRSVERIFIPSSIAVYGKKIDRKNTVDDSPLYPATMYGVTKVAGELLQAYYKERYGLDVRSLRFPGVISWKAEPGGGSTDFAVDIYRQALLSGSYRCFVRSDSTLPFMYMDDVLRSIDLLMDAEPERISRTSYNVTGFSASASDFARVIAGHIQNFHIEYEPDFRQQIVDQWPMVLDDAPARNDWGWYPEYDLEKLSITMLENLRDLFRAMPESPKKAG